MTTQSALQVGLTHVTPLLYIALSNISEISETRILHISTQEKNLHGSGYTVIKISVALNRLIMLASRE